jgi:hypothetical protein
MESLGELLKTRLNAHNLSAPALSAQILNDANRILVQLLPKAYHSVSAYRLEQGRLYISAENPVLSQELWGVQAQLLKKLQTSHGENSVSKIIIKWFDNSIELH